MESGAGEARRRVGQRRGRLTSSARQNLRVLVMQSSAPAPGHSPHGTVQWAIEDSISQCPFLQMTYTAENPHADGSATPGARPRYQPTRHSDLHATSNTHDNWMDARQTSCRWRQDRPPVSKLPLHSSTAAKMSPHIRIGPEPVLAAHAPSPPAAGSHCPAREGSTPHWEQSFTREENTSTLAPSSALQCCCSHSLNTTRYRLSPNEF